MGMQQIGDFTVLNRDCYARQDGDFTQLWEAGESEAFMVLRQPGLDLAGCKAAAKGYFIGVVRGEQIGADKLRLSFQSLLGLSPPDHQWSGS